MQRRRRWVARCPKGFEVASGGFSIDWTHEYDDKVVASRPGSFGSAMEGWMVDAVTQQPTNKAPAAQWVSAYAICVRAQVPKEPSASPADGGITRFDQPVP